MRGHLYTDALALVAVVISMVALVLLSGHLSADSELLYASSNPALLLPSG